MKRPYRTTYTEEELKKAVKECYSVAATIKYFGLALNGGRYAQFNRLFRYYNIDISHFKGKGWNKGLTAETNDIVKKISIRNTYSDEEILIENSPYSKTSKLRSLMLKYGKEYKCDNDGCVIIDTWLGKNIILHIDHINGINNDNR